MKILVILGVLMILAAIPLTILVVGGAILWALNIFSILLPFSLEKAFACGVIFVIISNLLHIDPIINLNISEKKKVKSK